MTAVSANGHLPAAAMATAAPPHANDVAQAVAGALERLQVTDLVYEDLWASRSLTRSLAQAVVAAVASGGRVLAIGPNPHLAAVLRDLGYDLEVWGYGNQVFENVDTDATPPTLRPDDLMAVTPGGYDGIVVCLALERHASPPAETLAALRQGLRRDGALVVAAEQAGRLGRRLGALRGRGLAVAPAAPMPPQAGEVSWNWPGGPAAWVLSEGDWRDAARTAGLAVTTVAYTSGRTPVPRTAPLKVSGYLKAYLRHSLKAVLPRWRDMLVFTATPAEAALPTAARTGRPELQPLERVPQAQWPLVSVLLGPAPLGRTAQVLHALAEQTYPAHRIQVLVSADDPAPAPPPGLAVHTVAGGLWQHGVRAASGEVIAYLGEGALPGRYWVEGAVAAMVAGADLVVGALLPPADTMRLAPATVRFAAGGSYPGGNVFYFRSDLLAALEGGAADDTSAVALLQATGRQVHFNPHTGVGLPGGGVLDDLRRQWRWQSAVAAGNGPAGVPRALLGAGDGLLLGLALAGGVGAWLTRRRRLAVLALPWVLLFGPDALGGVWPPYRLPLVAPARVAARLLGQSVGMAALLAGAFMARRPLL